MMTNNLVSNQKRKSHVTKKTNNSPKKKPLRAFPRPKKSGPKFSLLLIASVLLLCCFCAASVLLLTAILCSAVLKLLFSPVFTQFLAFNFAFLGSCCAGYFISHICLGEFWVVNWE
jgi:hypothetical protein